MTKLFIVFICGPNWTSCCPKSCKLDLFFFFKRSVTLVGGSWSENNFLPVITLYSRVESRVVMIPMDLMLPNMPYWSRVCWDLIPHTLPAWNRALLLPRGFPVHQCSPPYTHTGQTFVIVVDICVVFRVGCQTRCSPVVFFMFFWGSNTLCPISIGQYASSGTRIGIGEEKDVIQTFLVVCWVCWSLSC